MPTEKRAIIIDTDPGQDDALALLLAFASPEVEILGIVTVAGNVPLELTTTNALKICELAGKADTPVYAGCARPMVRPLVTAEHVHGQTGLDGPDLPVPTMTTKSQHGVDFIIDSIRAHPDRHITLCTLGPLTNVAMALIKAPDIAPKIREIIMMGGGFFEGGNITPTAEFNIYVDPQAADTVFSSGVPIVVAPLDVTHKALTTQARVDALLAKKTPVCDAAAALIDFFERFDEDKYGTDGGPLHDPCVLAYLIKPSLFTGRHCNVTVETGSALTLGMTVIDWWGVTDRKPNALVLGDVDAQGFFDLLTERIATL